MNYDHKLSCDFSCCRGFRPIHICVQESPSIFQVYFADSGYQPTRGRVMESDSNGIYRMMSLFIMLYYISKICDQEVVAGTIQC